MELGGVLPKTPNRHCFRCHSPPVSMLQSRPRWGQGPTTQGTTRGCGSGEAAEGGSGWVHACPPAPQFPAVSPTLSPGPYCGCRRTRAHPRQDVQDPCLPHLQHKPQQVKTNQITPLHLCSDLIFSPPSFPALFLSRGLLPFGILLSFESAAGKSCRRSDCCCFHCSGAGWWEGDLSFGAPKPACTPLSLCSFGLGLPWWQPLQQHG